MSRFSSIKDVWQYLDNIPMFSNAGAAASNFGLKNIRTFCAQIGNPQAGFKSIHIAGTNGKGTTAHLLEWIYRKAGFKTGLFTSPHLLRYHERVRISGTAITDGQLLGFFREAEEALESVPLTYFEISTALAFWAFSKLGVDIAIIETGLGGRLDSTNIIEPLLSVISSVGFDHQDILGDSISEIASEKAGIIKKGVPVVVGNLDGEALKVIRDKAVYTRSSLRLSEKLQPVFEDGRISFEAQNETYDTHFIEPVNRWNLAISRLAVDTLQSQLKVDEKQLRSAFESFPGVPGRFEKMRPDREWFFSGSHNKQAIEATLEAVKVRNEEHKVLVLSMMKDKVKPEILREFEVFDRCYFYETEGERAASISDIRRYLQVTEIGEEDIPGFLNEMNTSLVIFAGSFYFYPTVKRWLTK